MDQPSAEHSGADPARIASVVVAALLVVVLAFIGVLLVTRSGDDDGGSDEVVAAASTTVRSTTTTAPPTTSSTVAVTTSAPPTTAPTTATSSGDEQSMAFAVQAVDGVLASCGWTGQGTTVVETIDFQLWLVRTTVAHDGYSDVIEYQVDTATEVPVPVPQDQLAFELIECGQ